MDDNALCILKMSGGALGTMAASWTVYGHECQSTVLYGTKGLMMIYSEPSAPIIINDLEGNRTSFAFETTSHNSGVIDEFVDALVHDREPEVSGKEALTTMRTIFGSIRSWTSASTNSSITPELWDVVSKAKLVRLPSRSLMMMGADGSL